MLDIQVKDDNVNIVFSRNLINDNDLMELLERIKVKHLISQSKLTEDDAIALDEELKSNWWGKNKEKFLDKIK
ncbi:MAG: hypothetical protein PVH61_14980 [Candidatus Aminicenantes bacterium]|jgi:hypothetical protein